MKIDIDQRVIIIDDGRKVFFDEICERVNASTKDIVYLGGSIIEGQVNHIAAGMGNKYSDVDVFIIRDHDEFINTVGVYEEAVRKTFFCENLPLGLDVEVLDKQYIESLANAIHKASIDPNGKVANVFKKLLPAGNSIEFINTILCRLKNSICIHGNGEYEGICSSIDFSKFLDLMIAQKIVAIDNKFDDVEGNLSVGQLDTALICIRRIVLSVMETVLMSQGFFSDREKWVQLKFKNLCLQDSSYSMFWEKAFELFRGDLSDDALCEAVISESIHMSKRTIERILLGGNDLL